MKTAFVYATALIATVVYTNAADCDLSNIESLLDQTTTQGLAGCANATGINIFAVNKFPTPEQVTELSQNVECVNNLNQINQVANAETQCNVTVEGVSINFGMLIADFLTGKTGNESDSGSGSMEIPSVSKSKLTDLENNSESPSLYPASSSGPSTNDSPSVSSASSANALSFVAYCVAMTLTLALQ